MMGFCKDVAALIICKSFGFTELSGNIIKKNLEKFGGRSEIFHNSADLDQFSHLIVPNKINKESLEKVLGKEIASINLMIVTEEWAYELFIKKRWVDPSSFLWKETQVPTPKRKTLEVAPSPKKLKIEQIKSSTTNLNFHLTNELEKLKNFYDVINDKGRTIQYGNIIRNLRLLPFKVEKIDQIKNLEGFGDKTLSKIKEILEKGSLDRLQTFNMNERLNSMKSLTEVHGIGNDLAYKLYKKGVTTFDLLYKFSLESPDFFTATQLVSIELHSDFQVKIPRPEVKEIAESVMSNLEVFDKDAKYEICGSYRRERDYCGDVDIVLCSQSEDVLIKVVQSSEIITHIFSLTPHKFIGVCKLLDHHRRIDIYCCKPNEFWFAVLYFTGSSNYNRMLRLAAGKSNLHLSNTGLVDLRSGNPILTPASEEDIINFLGFPTISLKNRDI